MAARPRPRQRDGLARRGAILAAVEMEPGIHVTVLAARTGSSWHTAAYHVDILERLGLVEVDKGDRERRVFPVGLAAQQRRALGAIRCGDAEDVLRALLEEAPQGIPDLSKRLGVSRKVVRRALAVLAAARLVRQGGTWRPIYSPDRPAAQRLLGAAAPRPPPPGHDGPPEEALDARQA